MYRNRTWYYNSFSTTSDGGFGTFESSYGFRTIAGGRWHMFNRKEAPRGVFLGAQLVFSYAAMPNIGSSGFTVEPDNMEWYFVHGEAGAQRTWAEFIPVLGYQFKISNRVFSEFYIGGSYGLFYSEKVEIVASKDMASIGAQKKSILPVCWKYSYPNLPGRLLIKLIDIDNNIVKKYEQLLQNQPQLLLD